METIRAAAFKCPITGSISEADTHADAFYSAEIFETINRELGGERGYEDVATELAKRLGEDGWAKLSDCDGFTTSTGRFLNRSQSLKIALAAKQLQSQKSSLNAEDLVFS